MKRIAGRATVLALVTVMVGVLCAVSPVAGAANGGAANPTFVFNGTGRAHGVGMCMDGVYYRATDGWGYHAILEYYYTGISYGRVDDNMPIRVKGRDGQIRTLTMREYLYHLQEEPESCPIEELKALYAAARTYTISCIQRGKHAAEGFDICSSGECCQAFDENKDISKYPKNCQAVDVTNGEIITYAGKPITAAYCGSCGGHTDNNEDVWGGSAIPYLRGKPDDFCSRSPRYAWSFSFTQAELEAKLNVGTLFSMDFSDRTPGGRVRHAVISGSGGTRTMSGEEFRATFGFPSTKYDLAHATFDEYLLVYNPNDKPATVDYVFMRTDGVTRTETFTVAARSRFTIKANDYMPFQDFAVKITARDGLPIIAERTMYFNYHGAWTGGTDAVGSPSPGKTWYFAEGNTLPGFDEWITVQNPGDATAKLTFHYMIEGKGESDYHEQVGGHSRATFNVAAHIGQGKNTSLYLESDQDIVAERPMYFNYQGLGANGWTGGHVVVGARSPAKAWYLAEGTTRSGFEEWLCLQNPNATDITVNATYMLGPGQGGPVGKSYRVPAKQRLTISVNHELGPEKDASVRLTSTADFIAERPMYFDYQGKWDGGHDVLGAGSPAPTWYLAEGYTGQDFDEWLCIQNPGGARADLSITYNTPSGSPIVKTHSVPANTRLTINVNKDAGANLELSARVSVTNGQNVIVERPMYFNYQGQWSGGHDGMAVTSPSTSWYFAEGCTR